MSIENVLITGGGGFIGSHLVAHQLALGRQVTVVDTNLQRLESQRTHPGLRLVEGDIRDVALLEKVLPGINVVFHLASAHLEIARKESHYWEVNVTGTRGLALAAAHEGVNRFVHCSSVGVYGPLTRVPADENSPCHPEIAYEVTKLEGERAVLAVAEEQDLPVVVLRPSWVYGPGCPRTRKLIRAIRKRRFLMVGKGHNLRHPVFIDDLLQAFELAATRNGIEGHVFVIASSEYVTLEKLVKAVQKVEGSHCTLLTVPPKVMRPVCHAMELAARLSRREPPFSRRSLKFFTEDSAFDITKAKNLLGFEPIVDLISGLEKTRDSLSSDLPA